MNQELTKDQEGGYRNSVSEGSGYALGMRVGDTEEEDLPNLLVMGNSGRASLRW